MSQMLNDAELDAQIEAQFKKLKLDEPSPAVLARVIENARRELKPNFFASLSALFARRELSWAAMIVLVLGLSVWLKMAGDKPVHNVGFSQSTATVLDTENTAIELSASVTTAKPADTQAPVLNQDSSSADYDLAVSLFNQAKFKEAADLFAAVINDNPKFEKRVELYGFWIESLEKIGDTTLATQKRDELKTLE